MTKTTITPLSFGQAMSISAILGKCTIKSLGSDLFFPVIKLKANLSSTAKKFYDLQDTICAEAGVKSNGDGTLSIIESTEKANAAEAFQKVGKAFNSLTEDSTDVIDYKLLSEKQFQDLFQENPTLTTGELEVLMVLVA